MGTRQQGVVAARSRILQIEASLRGCGDVIASCWPLQRRRRSRTHVDAVVAANSGVSATSPAMITTFQTSGAIAGIVNLVVGVEDPDRQAVESAA